MNTTVNLKLICLATVSAARQQTIINFFRKTLDQSNPHVHGFFFKHCLDKSLPCFVLAKETATGEEILLPAYIFYYPPSSITKEYLYPKGKDIVIYEDERTSIKVDGKGAAILEKGGECASIWVEPSHRKLGYGTFMINQLDVKYALPSSGEVSQSFWRKHNFRPSQSFRFWTRNL